jgi:cystathionine beta-lyase
MIYQFDQIPDRRQSDSLKWTAYPPDVLPLWVADMDFVSPEPVLRALQARSAHGIFGYPRPQPALRQLIVERLERLYGWPVQPDEVLFVPGVVKGINLAGYGLVQPGEAVLVQPPVYSPFLEVPHNIGAERRDARLARAANGHYEIDWEVFDRAITPATRLFILCNPHNPVGRVFSRAELLRMAEICLKRGVVICSDEIHCDLVYRGQHHIPIAALSPESAANTITLMAPSKTFNIAGLQCSFAVIQNPQLRARFQQAGKGLAGWVNLMGLTAMRAAYQEGQEWLEQLLDYLEGNRAFLVEFVHSQLPGVSICQPEGTYLAWLDCTQAGIAGSPYQFFLEKARVALNEGASFGLGGEGYVRLNFGCPRHILSEALERMKNALIS